MKDVFDSVKSVLTLRLKSPILGAFVLSWILLHWKGILLFILVDTPQKIEMIHSKEMLFKDDVLFPSFFAFLALIGLPIQQLIYETIVEGKINVQRIEALKSRNQAEIYAEPQFIKRQRDEGFEEFLTVKENVISSIGKLRQTLDSQIEIGFSLSEEKFFHELQKIVWEFESSIKTNNMNQLFYMGVFMERKKL